MLLPKQFHFFGRCKLAFFNISGLFIEALAIKSVCLHKKQEFEVYQQHQQLHSMEYTHERQ